MKETKNQSIRNLLDCLDSLIKSTERRFQRWDQIVQAVIHDMETDINMPFVLNVDKSGMLDMVVKQ